MQKWFLFVYLFGESVYIKIAHILITRIIIIIITYTMGNLLRHRTVLAHVHTLGEVLIYDLHRITLNHAMLQSRASVSGRFGEMTSSFTRKMETKLTISGERSIYRNEKVNDADVGNNTGKA